MSSIRNVNLPNQFKFQVKLCLLLVFSVVSINAKAQYRIEVSDSNTFDLGEGVLLNKTSFRGLSVVNDNTIWVSGSRGTIARSIDGGKSFAYRQLKGYERSDFRDIEAFDEKRAIIMSSGTPAYILKTTDGGQSWKEVYKNTDSAYFLDAMDFWDDQRGMLVGDPINGYFVLLQTNDGGETWQEMDTTQTPETMEGEAVFAASGTSLRCWGKKEYGFVSGGTVSRFFHKKNARANFVIEPLPLVQGKPSQGAFSMAIANTSHFWLFAGGDYVNDTQSTATNFCSISPQKSSLILNNHIDLSQTNGYKSCVEVHNDYSGINGPSVIATGTSGTAYAFRNCGYIGCFFNFTVISYEPFHVVRKAKKGKAVFLAGPKGKIGKLIY